MGRQPFGSLLSSGDRLYVEVANVGVISLVDDTAYLGYTKRASSRRSLLVTALYAGIADLMASEITLRFMRSALCTGLALRYAIVVLTMHVGGGILGTPVLVGRFPFKGYAGIKDLIGSLFMNGAIGALFGAQLGFLEDLILAFPLSGLLSLFGRRT